MDVGAVINHYKVVEHIGRGGMADVWSARDQRLNRMVAIKTIAHGLTQDGEGDPVDLFKVEAQTIAQMEHPHILPIYDFGEFEAQLYIVMRYVAGGSLEDVLRRGPLSITEGLRLGQAIAQALDYAHENKVVHLDLKPPNILLDSHNSPYLADFGLATVLDREGKATNPGSGTLLYMAPEQLTAETIDYRADLYSFAIVIFHMLTGQLPFEGSMPLALRQLQFHEDMPDLEQINPALPGFVTDILRRATSVEPDLRPGKLMHIIDEIRDTLAQNQVFSFGEDIEADPLSSDEIYAMPTEQMGAGADAELLEAVDIYSRARHAWAGGNGRFLLGVTHFMVMNGYYMEAAQYGLEVDENGMQMLLRGAIEYDQEVEYWWNQLDNDNRRWVCLHAVRSGNSPARVRALHRLETLPDAAPPQIPKLVSQALQVETNEEARLAALQVLATRAKIVGEQPEYHIQTQYRGRLLTTLTRQTLQINLPSLWREVVYTPEIDLLIAEIAMDNSMPRVAEYAARTVGRIRSITAVRHIAREQRRGRRGALKALALIRDEAPNLPSVVSWQGRLYAWTSNTMRRITDDPMRVVWRYVAALVGAWIAMAYHIVRVYRGQAIFTQQRWANAIAMGLVFALITGFAVLLADEFPSRVRNFWPNWVRGLASIIMGTVIAAAAWYAFIWFFLQLEPSLKVTIFGGLGIALGLTLTTMLRLRGFIAVPLIAFLTFVPIYIAQYVGWQYQEIGPFEFGYDGVFQLSEALLYYDYNFETPTVMAPLIWRVALPFAILVAVGSQFSALVADVKQLVYMLRGGAAGAARRQRPEYVPLPAVPMITREIPAPKVKRESTAANEYDEEDEEFAISEPGSLLTEHDPAARLGDDVLLTDEHPAVEPPKRAPQVDTSSEPYLATEPDAVKGLRARQLGVDKPKDEEADTYTQSSDVRHVRLSTGIKINLNTEDKPAPKKDTGPSTELDMNLGRLLGREEPPKDEEEDENGDK